MSDEVIVAAAAPAVESLLKPFDAGGLYRVELFTDMAAGEIRVFTPVRDDGTADLVRKQRFFSNLSVMYRGRPLQINFEIEAGGLAAAVAGFQAAGDAAGRKYIEELESQAFRTQLASGGPAAHRMAGPRLPVKTH